jgi:cyclic beta-1,2-glucan synthetase
MQSVDRRLVRRDDRLILLLDPPFDKSTLNPGYIKGYLPGVRENGGQYTHSAIWTVMATAAMGDKQRAWELFSLINPIAHGSTPTDVSTYRVEPYVVAADVYGVQPHNGRGGWTWYTGSAGWMYRLLVESLFGLHLETNKLRVTPCLYADWPTILVHYRYRQTFYHITIHNKQFNNNGDSSTPGMSLDGVKLSDDFVTLVDDGRDHHVEVMG